MQRRKSHRKTKFKITQDYIKSQDNIQSQSSHREVCSKKEGDTQAKQMLNFQREEMQNIRQKIFFKKVVKRLYALISLSKAPTDLTQEWQRKQLVSTQKIQENQNISENTQLIYPWMKTVSIIEGICLIIIVWMLSIIVVFQQKLFTLPLFIFLTFEIIFFAFRSYLLSCNKQFSQAQWLIKLKKLLSLSLSTVACSIMLIRNNIEQSSLTLVLDTLVLFIIVVLSGRVSSNFQIFRLYAENKKVIKELRILQMFCILFVIAHTFGLIIYSSTYITPAGEDSWISYAKLTQKTWRTKYVYSIYWAITTIATVGYGDLTPRNEVEVIIIVILQICGTSFFGYMINVIGITVDNINKKNIEYDNYQQTISKLKDHYQLSDQLCLSMKNDIKKKYEQSDKTIPLKKNEETELLQFVDSTVKRNFILQTNIKIIKKSIFFLTYFTVNFQNQIALKLIRSIYKKDQNIETFDPTNKQRNIVIINHGKVSLFLKKRQNNSIIHKLIRNIQPIEGKPTLNVIGYSNLILNQNIDISAVADEMTSGYVLKRSDVMECIDKSLIDYESLHEMRQKMLLISLKESIQAPSLKDSNFHFTPNVLILTYRHSKQSKQFRKKKTRRDLRCQLIIDQVKIQFDNNWFTVKKEDSQSYYDQEFIITKNFTKKINEFQSLLSIEEITHQNEENSQNPKESQQREYLRLDQVKIFEHFMKNYNINTLALQYEKSCKVKSYKKRILTKVLIGQPVSNTVSQRLMKKLKTLKSDKSITNNKS